MSIPILRDGTPRAIDNYASYIPRREQLERRAARMRRENRANILKREGMLRVWAERRATA